MDSDEILSEIKSMPTEGLEADTWAEITAFTLASVQSSLSSVDLRKLILLSAAAYHLAKEGNTGLQQDKDPDSPPPFREDYSKRTLH